MHIEVWKAPRGKQLWHWHLKSKGRTVGDAEAFPSKGNAIRAATAVVRGVINVFPGKVVRFTVDERVGKTIIRWGGMEP